MGWRPAAHWVCLIAIIFYCIVIKGLPALPLIDLQIAEVQSANDLMKAIVPVYAFGIVVRMVEKWAGYDRTRSYPMDWAIKTASRLMRHS